jgi:hypothetical protein
LAFGRNPNLIITQSQADFITNIEYHSGLSEVTIIPDTELANNLFL